MLRMKIMKRMELEFILIIVLRLWPVKWDWGCITMRWNVILLELQQTAMMTLNKIDEILQLTTASLASSSLKVLHFYKLSSSIIISTVSVLSWALSICMLPTYFLIWDWGGLVISLTNCDTSQLSCILHLDHKTSNYQTSHKMKDDTTCNPDNNEASRFQENVQTSR